MPFGLLILYKILCHIPQVAAMGQQFSRQSTVDQVRLEAQFDELYSQLISNDNQVNIMPISQITRRLHEACELISSLQQIDIRMARIQSLYWIATDVTCTKESLDKRFNLEQVESQYRSLASYVKYHNWNVVGKCALALNAKLARDPISKETNTNTIGAVQSIRRQQLRDRDHVALAADLNFVNTSRGLINYLEQLGYNVNKPRDTPMLYQIDSIVNLLNRFFLNECFRITQNHMLDDLAIYESIIKYSLQPRRLFDRDVIRLFQRLKICHWLRSDTIRHVYPIGRFNSVVLISEILTDEPVNAGYHPDRMKEMLDIVLYVFQAELLMGDIDTELAVQFIDLLTISQIREQKCQSQYLKAILNIKQMFRRKARLISYLDYYGRLQLLKCLPQFELSLKQSTSVIAPNVNLDRLEYTFRNVKTKSYPNVQLYLDIPEKLQRVALEKFMNSQNSKNPWNLNDLRGFLMDLMGTCQVILKRLTHFASIFEIMIQLDTSQQKVIDRNMIDWMTRYKICQNISLNSIPLISNSQG